VVLNLREQRCGSVGDRAGISCGYRFETGGGDYVAVLLRSPDVADIPARELRNDVSAVLRRVEAGERLRVTVSGRPVAELAPLPSKPTSIPWEQFRESLKGALADSGLTDQLAELIPDTTDDLPLP
jgi:prevent-host-death family protein